MILTAENVREPWWIGDTQGFQAERKSSSAAEKRQSVGKEKQAPKQNQPGRFLPGWRVGSRTGAYCAVARKLARLSWSLVKHGGSYDPQRVYTRPEKKPQKKSEGQTAPVLC